MTMQVGVGESASRPISRLRHGFAACADCCEPAVPWPFRRRGYRRPGRRRKGNPLAQEVDLRSE